MKRFLTLAALAIIASVPASADLPPELQAKFVKINIDEAAGLAVRYRITGVPTLLFFHNGEVRDSIVGLGSMAMIRSRINQAVNGAATVVQEARA
mgnify:CR=1 FL=1